MSASNICRLQSPHKDICVLLLSLFLIILGMLKLQDLTVLHEIVGPDVAWHDTVQSCP